MRRRGVAHCRRAGQQQFDHQRRAGAARCAGRSGARLRYRCAGRAELRAVSGGEWGVHRFRGRAEAGVPRADRWNAGEPDPCRAHGAGQCGAGDRQCAGLYRPGTAGPSRSSSAGGVQTMRGWHVYYLQNGTANDVAYVLQQAFTPNSVTATPSARGDRAAGQQPDDGDQLDLKLRRGVPRRAGSGTSGSSGGLSGADRRVEQRADGKYGHEQRHDGIWGGWHAEHAGFGKHGQQSAAGRDRQFGGRGCARSEHHADHSQS